MGLVAQCEVVERSLGECSTVLLAGWCHRVQTDAGLSQSAVHRSAWLANAAIAYEGAIQVPLNGSSKRPTECIGQWAIEKSNGFCPVRRDL